MNGLTRRGFLGVAGGLAGGSVLGLGGVARAGTGDPLVYLGSYTESGGRGLMAGHANRQTGALTVDSVVAGLPQPSYLAVGPDPRRLYAVSEVADGQVYALAVNPDGSSRVLNRRPTGGSPAHLSVHPSGRHLLSANYVGGSVAVHPIGADGTLGPRTDLVKHTGSGPRPDQAQPHAHQIVTDPMGGFVLAVDLGTDTVYTYKLDLATGKLRAQSQAKLKPGAGPRHLAFHPDGRTVYVINELNSTITVFAYDPNTGRLTAGQTVSTVPAGTPVANFPGEILVSPDGRYVYGSNRGHNSVAVLATGAAGRSLSLTTTVPCGGDWPRHMELAAGGRLLYVANQRSGTVATFTVDGARLTPAGAPLATPAPAFVLPRF